MIDLAQRIKIASLLNNDEYANIAAVNAAALVVDTKDFARVRSLILVSNEDAGGDTTVSVEHSDSSGSGFAAVTAEDLTDANTAAAATLDNLNTAGWKKVAINLQHCRRYVRIQVATAFGSASAVTAVLVGEIAETARS